MANLAMQNQTMLPQTKLQKFWVRFIRNWQLHAMIFLPMCYLILFHYVPLYGIQVAFKDYSPRKGIWGSEWVGLKYVKEFFEYYLWKEVVVNTLVLSLYGILASTPVAIGMALIIHINTGKTLKKVAQNVSYIPHFISLVVMVGILNSVLNPISGFVSHIYRAMGVVNIIDIRGDRNAYRHLYVWSDIWQNMGWDAIIYVSALAAVSDDLHEAAKIDGASRLRRVFSVDFPAILPTVALLFILRFGSIMSLGYQKAYLMQNDLNMEVSEIISTFTYKRGLRMGNTSFGVAVGLLQQAVNAFLVFFVNWIANLLSDNELGMF